MTRIQISTSVSNATRSQVDKLMKLYRYSLRDIITLAISDFYRKEVNKMEEHTLQVPDNAGKGLTSWIATCTCGASWRCEYSRFGLEWKPQNENCHNCPHNK